MIDVLRRHEIQVLRRAGHSPAEVAKAAGVSRRSVVRVEAEAAVNHIDNQAERTRRKVGRPSKAEPYRSFVLEQLAKEPERVSRSNLGFRGSVYCLPQPLHAKVRGSRDTTASDSESAPRPVRSAWRV